MVRKWSYINTLATFDMASTGVYDLNTFKVFRATTRFKKYNIGPTKLVRKTYTKRKHRTNWVTLSYITNKWSTFFLKNKQFLRFYQSIGLFNVQSYSTTIKLFNTKNTSTDNFYGFMVSSCSKKIINYFFTQSTNFFKTPLPTVSSVMLATRNYESYNLSHDINPGLINYENLIYVDPKPTSAKYLLIFLQNQNLLFRYILNVVKIFYKIFVLITLHNISSFN